VLCNTRPVRRLVLCVGIALVLAASACSDTGSQTGERSLNSTAATPQPGPEIKGEPVEITVPETTNEVAVIGLPATETLSIHALPGIDQLVIGEIPGGADKVVMLGQAFETDDGLLWWLVQYDGIQGWVQPQVAYPGGSDDVTELVLDAVGDATTFASVDDLVDAVAEPFVSDEGSSRVVGVSSSEPDARFRTQTTVDVIGLADDSILGYRLLVTTVGTADDEAQRIERVQRLPLCGRGVTPDGLCT
jgi:hypothetical protein